MVSSNQITSLLLLARTGASAFHRFTLTPGCDKPLPANLTIGGNSTGFSINSGGKDRTFLIHIPPKYDINTPAPLIFSFHGRTKTAEEQEGLSQFSNSSYNTEAIAVYPQGLSNQWQGDPDAPENVNDIQFTLDLITYMSDNFCVSQREIYAAGKSNGGGLTGLLACDAEASAKIAAFAPVSGAFYLDASTGKLPPCNPSRNVPILEFHGFKDNQISYEGGPNKSNRGETISIVEWVNRWAKRDGFDPLKNDTTSVCSGKAFENKPVLRHSWDDFVIHYNISNLFHDWPSTFPNDDTQTALTCFDATTVIMEFFGKHTL